jgi:ADP-ribose pyrophosphatase
LFVVFPAGLRYDAGEDPLDTAKRELREEVELEARDWRHLLTVRPSAGITSEEHVIFLARGLGHADRGTFALRHEEADMESFWVPMGDLLDAVLAGRVSEGPIVAAVLAYDVLQRRGRL